MYHRFHNAGLLRKKISKKVVGSPWIHPVTIFSFYSDHRSTKKYEEVSRSTGKYQEVRRSTGKYEEVRRSTEKYEEVRRSTKKYEEVS